MMEAFAMAFENAAKDTATKAVIFTGAGDYYSAGVNLGGTLKLMAPKKLHSLIVQHNQSLFDRFLTFPKPILVAVNGPAIGASVTSATLCDAIIAADTSSYSTPFAALGISPEGCSSILWKSSKYSETAANSLKITAKDCLKLKIFRMIKSA